MFWLIEFLEAKDNAIIAFSALITAIATGVLAVCSAYAYLDHNFAKLREGSFPLKFHRRQRP